MAGVSGNSTQCNFSLEYKYTTYNVSYSLVFIFGLLGNASALYVFCKLSVKNRLSTIILINLAISDLIFILTLPLRIGYYMRMSSDQRGGNQPDLLDLACRVSTYLFYISMYSSIYFLTALSVCRYLVLSGRLRHQNQIYCRRVRLACLGIWVWVVGTIVTYVGVLDGFRINAAGCFEPRGNLATLDFLHRVNLLVLIMGFTLPLALVLLCYILMIRHILRARPGRRARDITMVCLVLLVFCLCFLPYHIQRTMHLIYARDRGTSCHDKDVLERSVVITLCLASANSCLDPLIFLFVGNGFLQAARQVLASLHTSRGGSTQRGWPWGKSERLSLSTRGNASSFQSTLPPIQRALAPLNPSPGLEHPKQSEGDDEDAHSTAL